MLQPSSLLSHPGFLPIAVAPPTFSSRSSCFSFPLPSLFSAIKPFPLAAASNSSSSSSSFPTFFPYTYQNHREQQEEPEIPSHQEEDSAIGDCLVFEDGAFEDGDPYEPPSRAPRPEMKIRRRKSAAASEVEPESLVPEKWKEAVEEINLTKKEKRRISHELRFASRMDRRKKSPVPDREEYQAQREMMLARLKPVVLDDPPKFLTDKESGAAEPPKLEAPPGTRATPRNPWLALKGETLEDVTDFFNSGKYVPPNENDDKKPQGRQKLFTTNEKILLNKRIPNLGEATSGKWLPLHSLATSGEFFLLDKLLKHNVDINGVDKDGLSAIHKAILCKKQAIVNYLLRNSANPFIRDNDGATLLHYAVLTASSETIKILQLYNVDINLADDDGWTPLHLAVQTQRTDIVRLLLIKGADRTLKNRDGLTPLDLCLYSGHGIRTYELIRLLKQLPVSK
ncbi:ankyrin repeat domain-containing protein, chloroplastic-like [Zingiber officinale]|uniref:ankyrin repeat domain-containing protein, chloroplastic-like n=1 Tax=Zingiber officinale TaxID=94328 RepID=UPI001C4C0F7B|nr:ankyrin repeat domain-containing protein, chloroplastic-like [Zingiber officinale]